MKPTHRYATATAFRIALEARLKSLAQAEGIDLQRLRRQVSFDRLLARLPHRFLVTSELVFDAPDAEQCRRKIGIDGQRFNRTG